MRILLALLLGALTGAGAVCWFAYRSGGPSQSAANHVEGAAKSARDAVEDKLRVFDLKPENLKKELAAGGQIVRRKAREAGKVIMDATADARVTAQIKAKLVADPELSALSVSVNTTQGVVTLSGTVSSAENISRAMTLAMDVEGVQEVISTLQVKTQ